MNVGFSAKFKAIKIVDIARYLFGVAVDAARVIFNTGAYFVYLVSSQIQMKIIHSVLFKLVLVTYII